MKLLRSPPPSFPYLMHCLFVFLIDPIATYMHVHARYYMLLKRHETTRGSGLLQHAEWPTLQYNKKYKKEGRVTRHIVRYKIIKTASMC